MLGLIRSKIINEDDHTIFSVKMILDVSMPKLMAIIIPNAAPSAFAYVERDTMLIKMAVNIIFLGSFLIS